MQEHLDVGDAWDAPHPSLDVEDLLRMVDYQTELAPGLLVMQLVREIEEESLVEEWEIRSFAMERSSAACTYP